MNKKKTHVITAAQGIQTPYQARMYGREARRGRPNYALIENMETYASINNADIQICAIAGAYVNEIELHSFFHKRDDVYISKTAQKRNLQNKKKEEERRDAWRQSSRGGDMPMHYFWAHIPDTDYKKLGQRLNTNVRVVPTNTAPQNQDPLKGKAKLTQKHGGNSIIVPSPKRKLKAVASGQAGEYPKIMMTTGACTHPSYNTSNSKGQDAYEDHRYGFAVVDVIDSKIYLPRMVPAQKNGTFIDLGIKYERGKDPYKVDTNALILGDLHVTEIDPVVDKANEEMMEWFKPTYTYLHDAMDSDTVSPHQIKDFILRMNKFNSNETSLEEELVLTAENIARKANLAQEWGGVINCVYDNHGDMLYRWLTAQHFTKDLQNAKTALKILAQDGLDRYNTIETALKMHGNIPNNVVFLKPGEDRIHWGYQCAAHGHLGKNGSRGSLQNLIEGYGKVIHGHVHQLEVIGDSISVGTSSKIPLDYQLGQPSTSMPGNAVIYDGGLAQALPIVKGRWHKDNFADHLK